MKRGIKTLIAGALLMGLGFVGPFLILIPLFAGDSSESQFLVPGSTEIEVEKPGEYHLWNDYEILFEGKSYRRSRELPDGLEITIKDEDGKTLALSGGGGASSISGSHSKVSVGTVELEKPGKVTVSVTGDFEERVFSFSEFGGMKLMWMILAGGMASILLVAVGLGVIVWGIVKLVTDKKPTGPPAIPSP